MRIFVVLGAVLLSAVLCIKAAPTEDCDSGAPVEPTADPSVNPNVHYLKEELDHVSRNTTSDEVTSSTKDRHKDKVKKMKNGYTREVITDSSKTKTKTKSMSDEFSQTNHTLTEDGVQDSTSQTHDKQHELQDTDVVKKKEKEVIIRDANGNIVSDKKKSHVKEKERKKERSKETDSFVHTVQKVTPPPEFCEDTPSTASPDNC